MINKENFHFYLRYLVKISDENPISYDEIPKEFQNFFTIPALSQALNISINQPKINWSKVEKYINTNSFISLDSLVNGINDNFQSLSDKIYATYYFIANNIDYNENRNSSISIDDIIRTKKALQNEFVTTFFEVAKKIGFTSNSIQIVKFHNDSALYKWNVFNPPAEPACSFKSILLKIDDEFFISQPYLGAGYWKNNSFCKEYRKVFFLIPYYKFLVSYYPENNSIAPSTYSYTWKNFSLLSRPDLVKELSFETNPYQIIKVTNGFYEFQFSLIQPCPNLIVNLFRKEGEKFETQNSKYTSITLLEKDIPNHFYSSYPDEKRCRYKISTVFPKKGDWLIKVFYNRSYFFEINFSVKKSSDELFDIPSYDKEEPGFIPITPLHGLTSVENGYARIRFAVKMKRSPLLIELYKVKPGTYDREPGESISNCTQYFTLELPSSIKNESDDPLEKLVEDWVLVQFPEDGRFEVYIYFKNDKGTFSYGVTYYFDVEGAKSHKIEYSIFDVPKNRTFIQFKTKTPEKVWAEPSSSIVLIDEPDFFFHVFSKETIKVYFHPVNDKTKDTVWPSLVQTSETSNQDIIDHEYTVTFPSNGQYELNFWGENFLGSQLYFVTEGFQYVEETEAEKSLMKKLKNTVEGIIEYNDDIPIKIRKDVDLMIVDAEGQRDERLQLEAKEREKKEKERKERREKILREREREDQLEHEKEEKERKEKEEKKKKEMEELKKYEKEVAEKESKMQKKIKNNKSGKSGSKDIDFLKQKTSTLEKEKEEFKLRFEEMERKEEEMRKEFQNEIERMKKDWNKKEEEEERARKQKNQKIEQEEEEEEKRARKESEKRINELRQRIKAIEIQLKFDPNQRDELVNLHEKLKSEEENDVIINSARTQKRLDRARQEERENEERKTNQEYNRRKYIAEKENEFIKSVRDEEDKFRKERAKLREQMNKNKKIIKLDEFEDDDDDDENQNNNNEDEFEEEEDDDENQNNNNEDEFEDDDDENQNNNNEDEFEEELEDDESDDNPNPEFEIDDDDEEQEPSNIHISKTADNFHKSMKTTSSNINEISTKSENPSDKPSGGKSSCCLLI